MPNENENNCTLFLVQGVLKLDIMLHKANAVDMSNKNENNFYIISCPERLLKLDITVRKANVLTYI